MKTFKSFQRVRITDTHNPLCGRTGIIRPQGKDKRAARWVDLDGEFGEVVALVWPDECEPVATDCEQASK